MLRAGVVLAVVALASPAVAQHQSPNCLGGCPKGAADTNTLLERPIYSLSSNPETKFADWVAYVVTLDSASGSGKPRNFRKDPDLDRSETLETPDYKGASAALGTQRGHLAPLGSLDGNEHWAATNYPIEHHAPDGGLEPRSVEAAGAGNARPHLRRARDLRHHRDVVRGGDAETPER